MVKQQVVTRQRERNKGRFKDETNCSRKLGKDTFQNHCDSKILKSLWNGFGFNENLSENFRPNYTGKAGCDTTAQPTMNVGQSTSSSSPSSYPTMATSLSTAFSTRRPTPRAVAAVETLPEGSTQS